FLPATSSTHALLVSGAAVGRLMGGGPDAGVALADVFSSERAGAASGGLRVSTKARQERACELDDSTRACHDLVYTRHISHRSLPAPSNTPALSPLRCFNGASSR